MPGFFTRDRQDPGQPAEDQEGRRLPARKPGEPSVTRVTRRIEFHLLYPWQVTLKARPLPEGAHPGELPAALLIPGTDLQHHLHPERATLLPDATSTLFCCFNRVHLRLPLPCDSSGNPECY